MKRNFLKNAALACCLSFFITLTADLSGKWSGVMRGSDGVDLPITYLFKVDGDKLTGSVHTKYFDLPINDGKINGVDFTFNLTDPNGLVIPHNGKYFTDSVSMNVDYQGAKMHIALKRDDK